MHSDNNIINFEIIRPVLKTVIELPLAEASISAGFPSPADDYLEERLDLNKALITHPGSTFYARVKGESMRLAGISDGDLLVIDKSKTPVDGSIVVCLIDGEFTVKRFEKHGDIFFLMPENPDYKPIKLNAENEIKIWGVVTYSIKKH